MYKKIANKKMYFLFIKNKKVKLRKINYVKKWMESKKYITTDRITGGINGANR